MFQDSDNLQRPARSVQMQDSPLVRGRLELPDAGSYECEIRELSDGMFGLALFGVAGFEVAGLAFASLAGLEPAVRRGDVLAQTGCLHEKVIHGVAVIAVGFRVGEAAFQLRPKVLRSLLQMFEITAVHSFLRSTGHKIFVSEIPDLPRRPRLSDRATHFSL